MGLAVGIIVGYLLLIINPDYIFKGRITGRLVGLFAGLVIFGIIGAAIGGAAIGEVAIGGVAIGVNLLLLVGLVIGPLIGMRVGANIGASVGAKFHKYEDLSSIEERRYY